MYQILQNGEIQQFPKIGGQPYTKKCQRMIRKKHQLFFMGVIPETFRKMTDVKRSSHPKYSFSAWGSDAAFITEKHALNFGFGEQSPLARLYELHAKIVLFGVDHNKNTSLHLAEHRAKKIPNSTGKVTNYGERQKNLAKLRRDNLK